MKIETNETSKKLGRGKHTTREVCLYEVGDGGYIADTPGFSSVDIEKSEIIYKEDLATGFREFSEFIGTCKFNDCSHTVEKGCTILEELEKGNIGKQRHKNYCELYEQAKQIKVWDKRNK